MEKCFAGDVEEAPVCDRCYACGDPASKTLYAWDGHGDVRAVPVCGKCYDRYNPVLRRVSVEL